MQSPVESSRDDVEVMQNPVAHNNSDFYDLFCHTVFFIPLKLSIDFKLKFSLTLDSRVIGNERMRCDCGGGKKKTRSGAKISPRKSIKNIFNTQLGKEDSDYCHIYGGSQFFINSELTPADLQDERNELLNKGNLRFGQCTHGNHLLQGAALLCL